MKEFKINSSRAGSDYGCVNDLRDRDYYHKDSIRILTIKFFDFMFGEDTERIIKTLKELIHSYVTSYLYYLIGVCKRNRG